MAVADAVADGGVKKAAPRPDAGPAWRRPTADGDTPCAARSGLR
ncbi:hypothetical protein DVDV_1848 [Desulfovibrio sp. DV]|nr:hypothetical protein DVDV_1848 [Desulfovibrio sp. DV]